MAGVLVKITLTIRLIEYVAVLPALHERRRVVTKYDCVHERDGHRVYVCL